MRKRYLFGLTERFVCDYCGKKFKTRNALGGHSSHCKARREQLQLEE